MNIYLLENVSKRAWIGCLYGLIACANNEAKALAMWDEDEKDEDDVVTIKMLGTAADDIEPGILLRDDSQS